MTESVRLGTLGANGRRGDRTLRLYQKIDALNAERIELGDPPNVVPYPIEPTVLFTNQIELSAPLREDWPSGSAVRLVIHAEEAALVL